MTIDEGDSTFAARLHGELRTRTGNLFYSPASVRIALTMAWAGARAETAAEIQETLGLRPENQVHERFAAMLRGWQALGHPQDIWPPRPDESLRSSDEEQRWQRRLTLSMVNRLWAQSGHAFRDEFLAVLRDLYEAPPALLDFHGAPEASRLAINTWVDEASRHKIRELLEPGTVTRETLMVLTNVVYFKATWAHPFRPEATTEQPFFVTPDRPVQAPLMRKVSSFPLGFFDDGQILELPYSTGDLVMDVVLPTATDGLPLIEAQLAAGALGGWLAALSRGTQVEVLLPRFCTSSSFKLAGVLAKLGMSKAFRRETADFSAMFGTRDLFIGDVVHQAFVDLDESGTEAAAANASFLTLGRSARLGPPHRFHADHPFLFLIRDKRNGVVLFVGRLADPTAG
jgi:serpin B